MKIDLKDKTCIYQFQQALLTWYDEVKRPLPWRESKDPYRIWISEIMLQQTQVSTVHPYYERFMEAFPDVTTLASASEDEVLKRWEGLGYYSRAKNIHKAAQRIVNQYRGVMPQTQKELLQLPGIGPYTAGAILSIAFNECIPAVDGNVYRIYTRLFYISEDIQKVKTQRKIQDYVQKTMSCQRAGDFNEALMDLGASLCRPKSPKCLDCPVSLFCEAYAQKVQEMLPVKAKKIKPTPYYVSTYIFQDESGRIGLVYREDQQVLSGFWMFPNQRCDSSELLTTLEQLSSYGIKENSYPCLLGTVVHRFTHQTWHCNIYYIPLNHQQKMKLDVSIQWFSLDEVLQLPQTTLQKKWMHLWQKWEEL